MKLQVHNNKDITLSMQGSLYNATLLGRQQQAAQGVYPTMGKGGEKRTTMSNTMYFNSNILIF
jgi:hypothetical protein